MDPAFYAFLAVGVSVLGLFVGAWAKRRTLVIIPFNDPMSLLLVLALFGILLMPEIRPEWAFIDPYDPGQVACIMGFAAMYVYGYVKDELLCEYVSAHNIFKLKQEIRPIVYYWNGSNQLCWQPQEFRYVLKRMLFNVDCPLDCPITDVSRRREITFQGKVIKQSAYCIDTAAMDIHEDRVVKWRVGSHEIAFKVLVCRCDPSPLNTYDAYDFYTEGRIADEYVQNYQKLQLKDMNASADLRMARILGAVKIVSSITSMTPDAVVMGRVLRDLEARNGDTGEGVRRASRVGVEDDESAARRRKAFEEHSEADR